jgi:hypothetical protein
MIDKDMADILKAAGLGQDACWKHKQSGKWIIYHWACERAAAHKGIAFDPPTIIHADPAQKIATICVTGRLGDKSEWSFGEAAPYNTQQTYPFAMAEKRGKDRVILKLIGLHGMAYSEEEADDFRQAPARNKSVKDADWHEGPALNRDEMKDLFSKMSNDVIACSDLGMLTGLVATSTAFLKQIQVNSPKWWDSESDPPGMKQRIEAKRAELEAKEADDISFPA